MSIVNWLFLNDTIYDTKVIEDQRRKLDENTMNKNEKQKSHNLETICLYFNVLKKKEDTHSYIRMHT